ncbi:MAG: LytTR family DNA-binding domain-containing protein [Chryseolinea sp.]
MKVLIIEDEIPAAEKLERYLHKHDPSIEIVGIIDTASRATEWLKTPGNSPDLIFMDIQLKDGLSFQIFQQLQVTTPVIFTTAFNEFALDAFKVNSIDYLLKPITFTALADSLKKLDSLRQQFNANTEQTERVKVAFSNLKIKDYKNRFMVKVGEHIKSITIDQISLFYADGRDIYLVTQQRRKFIIDYTLEGLESILDPQIFFRLNRTYIMNINAIKDVLIYSNSRLKIALNQEFDKEIIVSREKVGEFKDWFDGNQKD